DLETDQWRSVFRQLVGRGYLDVAIDRFGALILNESCRPVLRGEETVTLRRDRKARRRTRETRTPLPAEIYVGLWEALRDCRRSFAEEQGVPPYVVFHDRTLQEMCARLPRDLADLGGISGIGERKLAKYGPAFLAVIDAHLSAA
ncbi:MAG: HRDC domain-containing protein, partial [Pseudomonadota bacterium]